jgi:hypothetical protein
LTAHIINWQHTTRAAITITALDATTITGCTGARSLADGTNAPASLFRPYDRLVKISVLGQPFEVPENNPLLRCFQYLAPDTISYGRFCWNEDCQYCRVTYDLGEGTKARAAISCKLMVQEGMRIKETAMEIKYGLRDLIPSKNS